MVLLRAMNFVVEAVGKEDGAATTTTTAIIDAIAEEVDAADILVTRRVARMDGRETTGGALWRVLIPLVVGRTGGPWR